MFQKGLVINMGKVMTFSLCCFLFSGTASCVTRGSSCLETATDEVLLHLAKRRILDRLDLKDRPNTTNSIPRAALNTALRKVAQDGSVEIPNSSAQDQSYEIIIFPESGCDETWSQVVLAEPELSITEQVIDLSAVMNEPDSTNRSKTRLDFLLWNKGDQNIPTFIQRANLWLYFKLFPSTLERNNQNITVKIFVRGREDLGRTLISDKEFGVNRSGWHTFLVTGAIQGFFSRGDKGLSFDLECEGCNTAGGTPVFSHFRDESHQPFLKVKTRVREGSYRIQKRGIECNGKTRLCCRKEFYVDFRSIGWDDWIIAPRGYYSNYCVGSCPSYVAGAPDVSSSFHTVVFNLYKLNGTEPVVGVNSCCIPTQFSRASMLYFDGKQNIIKRDIPDMVVKECGCT
ncbi:inhibin beta B chain-like [Heptranchias perlo]|uniref:inhibin beta B chain-like n=1 Tax=Heptranchias perlo TaxID=212740 RepID=UPI003559720D